MEPRSCLGVFSLTFLLLFFRVRYNGRVQFSGLLKL